MLEATLEKLRQTVKIDISTGDVITPNAVEYSYRLMFEDRSISIWTYNVETLLGEKLETIMARENTNTRMRDFYDIHVLLQQQDIERNTFRDAFTATCEKRGTTEKISRLNDILDSVMEDQVMKEMWDKYCMDNYFIGDLSWKDVNGSVKRLASEVFEK